MSDAKLFTDLYAARRRTAAVAEIKDGETLVVAMAAGQPPSLLASPSANRRPASALVRISQSFLDRI
jgi:hypothetical protein